MSSFGRKLNPLRSLREPRGIKGIRQSVVITNNPSTIDQNQQLLVRFPNLGSEDVIVPGSARLAFKITLKSDSDNDRMLVDNIGRAIVRKTTIRISGNEILSIEDSDVFYKYCDFWRTIQQRKNAVYQGIDTSTNRNVTKLRIDAGDKSEGDVEDVAVAGAFGNRFCIPLDFELLESHMPFYQSALGDRLEYELTFNSYNKVIVSTDADASYTIEGISLEFEKVTHPELARQIASHYSGKVAILYDRVLRHRKIPLDKSDTLWNINLNVPAKSMKGVLLLFDDYYNPKITKVEITIEGVPNQLFSQGMRTYQQWDEILKFFSMGYKRDPEVDKVAKDLQLTSVTIDKYFTYTYALWLDMRTTDDNSLHGSGRRIENASEGITIQITKQGESADALNAYVYVIMDAQLNIEDGRFVEAVY